MHLLDTSSGTLHYFATPPTRDADWEGKSEGYAILSHVWSKDGEQSFQELKALIASGAGLEGVSPKIRDFCTFARRAGYRWAWIDSCCIDKTSSAELSEAINSMYEWYAVADTCFVYMEDVSDEENPCLEDCQFGRSRWFTRGWTLQELIAPRAVVFLSKEWRYLGTKASLGDAIQTITGIPEAILNHVAELDSVSVAQRMSWASRRQTTREEDQAYSLMGIFGIHMPTIKASSYGISIPPLRLNLPSTVVSGS